MTLRLPEILKNKALEFPESSQGANRVTLILSNNQHVRNVFIAWGSEIVKIGNREVSNEKDLGFKIIDVKDIVTEI